MKKKKVDNELVLLQRKKKCRISELQQFHDLVTVSYRKKMLFNHQPVGTGNILKGSRNNRKGEGAFQWARIEEFEQQAKFSY